MTFLRFPLAFIISMLFTPVTFAGPIFASLEALTNPTVLEGPMAVNERSTYKIIRKAHLKK